MADAYALADPGPGVPLLVDPAVPVIFVDDGCRLDPLALFPQPLEGQLASCLDELFLGVGDLGGHLGDLPSLHL
jgi:hypothetical protein